jgi:hypothetical protein
MNFSEFIQMLGAEPRSGDPEFRRARHSSPEFEQAAEEAEQFEAKLERSVTIPAPDGLIGDLQAICQHQPGQAAGKGWWPMALAASVLIAIGATGLVWNMNRSWDSVEDYLVDHYRHDGGQLVARADGGTANDVQAMLAKFSVQAAPALADIVGVIKFCPTPDGKGVHMVLNTESGPVTVIYMPETEVSDKEMLAFDAVEAILVDLQRGSAAIIGSGSQGISNLYAMVHDSIISLPGSS